MVEQTGVPREIHQPSASKTNILPHAEISPKLSGSSNGVKCPIQEYPS